MQAVFTPQRVEYSLAPETTQALVVEEVGLYIRVSGAGFLTARIQVENEVHV